GIGGLLEIVGGLLLLAGFRTRMVAFVLSGEMAVAYWMAHAPKSAFPAVNGGDATILFCFVFPYLVIAGPGAWSWDKPVWAGRAREGTDKRRSSSVDATPSSTRTSTSDDIANQGANR